MDFRITEEQELMVQAIEEAMTRENLEPYFQDCDKNHTHPEKWWEILKELGCFSMFLPEEAEGEDGEPGGGEGAVTMFLVMEALDHVHVEAVGVDLIGDLLDIAPAVGGCIAKQLVEQRIQHNVQQGAQHAENQIAQHFPVFLEKIYHSSSNPLRPLALLASTSPEGRGFIAGAASLPSFAKSSPLRGSCHRR